MPLDFPKFEGIETPEGKCTSLSVQELSTKENRARIQGRGYPKDIAVKLEVDNNMELTKLKFILLC